jgi:hypothetical protein
MEKLKEKCFSFLAEVFHFDNLKAYCFYRIRARNLNRGLNRAPLSGIITSTSKSTNSS